MKLARVHGAEEGVGDGMLSVSEDEVEGGIGADMKWLPRGVGKWSLRGDSQSAIFGDLSRLRRLSVIIEPRCDSSSSSIIVLSDFRRVLLCACTGGGGGAYVVAGRKSNVAIFVNADIAGFKSVCLADSRK